MSKDIEIKRWTAKRKAEFIKDVFRGKTTLAQIAREHDLPLSEVEGWMLEAQAGMENALRSNPKDVAERYEDKIKSLHEAYGEAMLQVKFLKKLQSLTNAIDHPIATLINANISTQIRKPIRL